MNTETKHKPRVSSMLTLSTAHLREETARDADNHQSLSWLDPIQYGYFCFAYEDFDDTEPAELIAICERARTLGCDWIHFDCDGPVDPTLQTWNW